MKVTLTGLRTELDGTYRIIDYEVDRSNDVTCVKIWIDDGDGSIQPIKYITKQTAAVLEALLNGCSSGKEIADSTGLRDGTVYPILRKLVSRGWTVQTIEDLENSPRTSRYHLSRSAEERAAWIVEDWKKHKC